MEVTDATRTMTMTSMDHSHSRLGGPAGRAKMKPNKLSLPHMVARERGEPVADYTCNVGASRHLWQRA